MKSKSITRILARRAALLLLLSSLNPQPSTFAQSTPFTYQGSFSANGAPFTGNVEMQFVLWDAVSAGNPVATNSSLGVVVGVTNGLFTVPLDFGSGPFNGADRYLQIDARTTIGEFTTLTPRQKITATPYALRSLSFAGDGGGVTNVNAALLDGLDSAQFLRRDISDTISGSLTVNSGAAADAVLTEAGLNRNLASDVTFNFSNGGAGDLRLLVEGSTVWHAGNDGAGSILDADLLDGLSSSAFLMATGGTLTGSLTLNTAGGTDAVFSETGIDRNSASGQIFTIQNPGAGGMSLLVENEVRVGDGSLAAPAFAFAVDANTGIYRPAADSVALVTAGLERLRITSAGHVGIGTSSPGGASGARLHVADGASGFAPSFSRTAIIEDSGNASLVLRTTNEHDIILDRPATELGGRINLTEQGLLRIGRHVYSTNGSSSSTFQLFLNLTNGNFGVQRPPATNDLEVAGNAPKETAGDWLANSDRRIKTDIRDVANARETVMKLRPVVFRYTTEWLARNPSIQDHDYYNFIAQEYREVFPDAVQGSGEYLESDTDVILQLDTHDAQIVTLKAVQELIVENQARRVENAELKARLSALEKLVANLKLKVN